MSASTDILEAVNSGVWDLSGNPWGMHDGGYLRVLTGSMRIVHIHNAYGTAANEINAIDFTTLESDATDDSNAIAAIVPTADAGRVTAETHQTDAETALATARAAAGFRLTSYF